MKKAERLERALRTIIGEGDLRHGSDLARTLRVGDLDVKITIEPRRALAPDLDLSALAFDALDSHEYGACKCAASVRERGYHLRRNSTKSCEAPIAFVIGRRGQRWSTVKNSYEERVFVTFACRVHKAAEEAEKDVIGTAPITSTTLKRWREEVAKRDAARKYFSEMSEEERIARDARLVGHPAANELAAASELDYTGANIQTATDNRFWQRTGYKPGKRLDPTDPEDARMIPTWLDIRKEVLRELVPQSGAERR